MRLDEWVLTRTVEAVVLSMDLADGLGRETIATPEGIAVTAAILDELLARRTVGGRPADLIDDLAFIRGRVGSRAALGSLLPLHHLSPRLRAPMSGAVPSLRSLPVPAGC